MRARFCARPSGVLPWRHGAEEVVKLCESGRECGALLATRGVQSRHDWTGERPRVRVRALSAVFNPLLPGVTITAKVATLVIQQELGPSGRGCRRSKVKRRRAPVQTRGARESALIHQAEGADPSVVSADASETHRAHERGRASPRGGRGRHRRLSLRNLGAKSHFGPAY